MHNEHTQCYCLYLVLLLHTHITLVNPCQISVGQNDSSSVMRSHRHTRAQIHPAGIFYRSKYWVTVGSRVLALSLQIHTSIADVIMFNPLCPCDLPIEKEQRVACRQI